MIASGDSPLNEETLIFIRRTMDLLDTWESEEQGVDAGLSGLFP